jgi:arginyl-tRNA synthetase
MNISQLVKLLQTQFSDYTWTVPPDLNMGVLTTNQAFIEAKKQGKNPKEIADSIKTELESFIESKSLPLNVKTVGPYVNIDLNEQGWQEFANSQDQFELEKVGKNVILDYVSPNVAKPLHAGHIRNADLGEALRRILKLKYNNLVTQNYWGDWGVQFGILIWGWRQFEVVKNLKVTINSIEEEIKIEDFESAPVDILSKVYVWANQQSQVIESFATIVRNEFLKLEQGDVQNRALWEKFLFYSKQTLTQDLSLLNVPKFDFEEGESFYEKELKVLYDLFEVNDIWQKEGLARYIDLETLKYKWVGLPDKLTNKIQNFGRCYLISSAGYTTYPFRDVAARWVWARDHQSDLMITVTGNEQSHNFEQFFAIVGYLVTLDCFKQINTAETIEKMQWQNLIHLSYGLLKLPEGKMSARKGNFLKARDLIGQVVDYSNEVLKSKNYDLTEKDLDNTAKIVAIAALKWYDLARDSVSDITLDLDKLMSFEGNTGVYQLYTVARLSSILEKNAELSINFDLPLDFAKLKPENEEILIFKEMFTLTLVLDSICDSYKPHQLCNHLFNLATKINSWYAKFSVSAESDIARKHELLRLCYIMKNHLWKGLELLGIEPVAKL